MNVDSVIKKRLYSDKNDLFNELEIIRRSNENNNIRLKIEAVIGIKIV